LSIFSDHLSCQREFDTCKQIVSSLEVIESDISNSLSNGTISVILPASKVVEVSGDWRILPVRVRWIRMIERESLARIGSWNHVMEDSQSISTH